MQPGDVLEVLAIDVNTWSFQGDDSGGWCPLSNQPDAGATSTRFTIDLWSTCSLTSARNSGLLKASRGDKALFAQLSRTTSDAGLAYTAMVRAFQPSGVEMTQGQETVATGAMTNVSASASLSVDLRASQFSSLVLSPQADGGFTSLVTPASRAVVWAPPSGYFSVQGQPGTLDFGQYSSSADYAFFAFPPGSPDIATGGLDYGRPMSAAWGTYAGARMAACAVYQLSTGAPLVVPGVMGTNLPLGALLSGPFAPLVSPVRNLRVGTQAALSDVSGVGLTPRVSWDAPTLGAPTYYKVFVQRLFVDASQNTRRSTVATFITLRTQVDVPAGILAAGEQYLVVVEVRVSDWPDAYRAPFRSRFPEGIASVVSGIVQP